jgi:hypothetical protein
VPDSMLHMLSKDRVRRRPWDKRLLLIYLAGVRQIAPNGGRITA